MYKEKWKMKLARIRGRMKIIDAKCIGTFILASIIAFLVHTVFPAINVVNGLGGMITLLSIMINLCYIARVNRLMDELEDKIPIPYQYLPDKYQEMLNINAWVPISIVLIMIFLCFEWINSILVIAGYWGIDYLIREYEYHKERNLYFEERKKISGDLFSSST